MVRITETPLELTGPGRAWSDALSPRGFEGHDVEPFDSWIARNCSTLNPLDYRVYEQWVYRHWIYSEYFGLPLDGLQCRTVKLSTAALLQVGAGGNMLEDRTNEYGESIFEHFKHNSNEPMRTMNSTGTWDFPILLFESSGGFLYRDTLFKSRFWLIEGHLRLRHLVAISAVGIARPSHDVLVLSRS
jgi:hypothetical protein